MKNGKFIFSAAPLIPVQGILAAKTFLLLSLEFSPPLQYTPHYQRYHASQDIDKNGHSSKAKVRELLSFGLHSSCRRTLLQQPLRGSSAGLPYNRDEWLLFLSCGGRLFVNERRLPMDSNPLKDSGESTPRIVNFVRETGFSDLPSSVVTHGKLVLLDTLGAMLAASNPKYPAGKVLVHFIKSLGGKEESSIIGHGFKSSCTNAAIVNGTFGYYCDIDAHHPEAIVHPAATVTPTSLAVGEREKVDGKEFLIAWVLGMEMDCRVSLALNPRALYDRGFHPSCVAGTIGAAISAGRLFRLSADQFPIALGLGAQQASGLLAWKDDFSENSRPFNHSIAARNGITSAFLAQLGFGAPPDIFEGRYHLFRAFSEEGRWNREYLTQSLGKDFFILGLAFKKYSCCAFLHPGLDALLHLMNEHFLKSSEIEEIVFRFPKQGTELIDGMELRSHSAQYILPVAAVHRQIMIDDILYDRMVDPEVKRLVERTVVVGDEVLDKVFPERYASIVEVKTTHGKSFSKRVDYAAGTPQNPFNQREIEEKYFRLCNRVVDSATSRKIMEMVENIERVDDINRLGDLLRK
jgi:2-methylcitrate dehydratase PrpD